MAVVAYGILFFEFDQRFILFFFLCAFGCRCPQRLEEMSDPLHLEAQVACWVPATELWSSISSKRSELLSHLCSPTLWHFLQFGMMCFWVCVEEGIKQDSEGSGFGLDLKELLCNVEGWNQNLHLLTGYLAMALKESNMERQKTDQRWTLTLEPWD